MIQNESQISQNILDNYTNNHLKVNLFSGLHVGKIKDNTDILKMGRARVHLSGSNRQEDDEKGWITCLWSSPFAGSTSEYEITQGLQFSNTQKSYGWWAIPPDIDNYVIVAFPDGLVGGIIIACIPQFEVNHSIPGLAYNENNVDGSVKNLPLAEKNRKVQESEDNYKIAHEPFLQHLKAQGLDKDKLRGVTSSSARRESPSNVYGFLSPKQHQFIVDDGKPIVTEKNGVSVEEKNYLVPNSDSQIRIRTQNGMQVLMHSEKNVIYINNADGSCWLEIDPEGNLHVFSAKNISFNANENINFHASKDINIEAKNDVVIRAQNKMIIETGSNDINVFSGKDFKLYATAKGHIKAANHLLETAPRIDLNGPVADTAEEKKLQSLSGNKNVTQGIVTEAPEHEPWAGHSTK